MPESKSSLVRLGAAGACVIACAFAGCGSDDASKGDTSSTTGAAATKPAPSDTAPAGKGVAAEKRRVADVVEGMYADMAASDAAGVCGAMSNGAREQIAQQVPGGSTEAPADRTCEASMAAFLGVAAQSGVVARTAGAKVTRVSIRGRNAVARVDFKGTSGKIDLRKEDGDWRFGAGPVGPRT